MEEALRAIAARIKRADDALSRGDQHGCGLILQELLHVLPEPHKRHDEAAKGKNIHQLKIVKE